jgi:hypothetical protein
MNNTVWVLDENEGDRSTALEWLAQAGIPAIAFSSPRDLLSYAQKRRDAPQAAVVDAHTAEGREREIRNEIPWRLTVLTTQPYELTPWLSLGVSRSLPKPCGRPALLEHLDWRNELR